MIKVSLIIGKGEVGKSLWEIMAATQLVLIRGKTDFPTEKNGKKMRFNIIHICFPYFKGFEKEVKKYQKQYNPQYTVIHSTVPVGTSRKCGAYHSPIRGVHPNLIKGIKTFTKYLAPRNLKLKTYFEKAGIKIETFNKPETTELLKILSTTYYAWNIVFCKEVKKICNKHKLDFNEVYTKPNKTYNEGYIKLGKANVIRPILKPIGGELGGHCLISNCKLLKNALTATILQFNKKYRKKAP